MMVVAQYGTILVLVAGCVMVGIVPALEWQNFPAKVRSYLKVIHQDSGYTGSGVSCARVSQIGVKRFLRMNNNCAAVGEYQVYGRRTHER